MFERACQTIREQYSIYLGEFINAQVAEEDEDFITYVGDKHYFEFKLDGDTMKLVNITDIVYF